MAVRSRLDTLALCAGVAGLELGVRLAVPRSRLVCAVERDAYAAATLVARMADKTLDQAPVWDDVATFDGRPWRGVVDLVTGGFPCQPWSQAGSGLGTADPRWLWPHLARIISEVAPPLVFLENVPRLASGGGLALVVDDLAALGFMGQWGVVSAADLGAPHLRRRLFVLAYRHRGRQQIVGSDGTGNAPRYDADRQGRPAMADPGGVAGGLLGDPRVVGGPQAATRRPPRKQPRHAAGDRSEAVGDTESVTVGTGLRPGEPGILRGGRSDDPGREDVADTAGPVRRGPVPRPPARLGSPDRGPQLGDPSSVGERKPDDETGALTRERSRARSRRPGGRMADADVGGLARSRRAGPDAPPGRVWPPGPDDTAGWSAVAAEGGPVPSVRRVADGLADRVDRLHAIGNGVVPVVAAYAFLALADRAGLDLDTLTGDPAARA